MTLAEELARETCEHFLTAAQIRAACRHRGFATTAAKKAALVDFLSTRWLQSTGVSAALASLSEDWQVVLHAIAMSQAVDDADPHQLYMIDPHPGLDMHRVADLLEMQARSFSSYDYPSVFRRTADELLARGVVLVTDPFPSDYAHVSRYARLHLMLAEEHRQFLPPFPVAASRFSGPPIVGGFGEFLCRVLGLALGHTTASKPDPHAPPSGPPVPFTDRVAARFSLRDGRMLFDGAEITSPDDLLAASRREWVRGTSELRSTRGRRRWHSSGNDWRTAALHILHHLPDDHGCSPKSLTGGLIRLGYPATEGDVAAFCDQGHRLGFLLQGPIAAGPGYRAVSGMEPDGATREPTRLSVSYNDARGIRVDLDPDRNDATGEPLELLELKELLQLLALSRARATTPENPAATKNQPTRNTATRTTDTRNGKGQNRGRSKKHRSTASKTAEQGPGGLFLEPDIVRLGRAADRLETLPFLSRIRAACPAYDQALRHVETACGQLVFHDGLLVMRVEDLGLRALLCHQFGDSVQELGGQYLVFPRGLARKIVQLAGKEGFSPRVVS